MEKVTTIVTVYNLESVLEPTMRSLMAQTYPELEILVVDDGSTDGSPAMLAAMAEEDPRIRIITRENGGVGSARNLALDMATGTYVMILDGDDLFEPTMVERLVEKMEQAAEPAVDIAVCRTEGINHETGEPIEMAWSVRMDQIPARDPFKPTDMADYLFTAFIGWPWDKMYRRGFLEREQLRFPSLKNSEDLYFTFLALSLAGSISVCDEILVHYRNNRGTSISGSRIKAPDEFYNAICLFKKRLQESPRYHAFEWGLLNWALDYTLWNILTLPESAERSDLVRRLVTGDLTELELDHHSKDYFGMFPRSAMNYDFLRAEYEGKPAPRGCVDNAVPKMGLVAEVFKTWHLFGWNAVQYRLAEWKGRRSQSGGDAYAVSKSFRGRTHWNLSEKE